MQINEIQYEGALSPAAVKRIGVVALATDLTIERDMPRMLPPGVEMFTTRVKNENPLNLKNLRAMQDNIANAAATLLPGRGVHAAIYACTSGTAAIGENKIQQCMHAALPGIPVITPLSALDAAREALNIKTLSILTPYSAEINRELAKTQSGQTALNIDGLGFDDDMKAADIPPAEIVRAAKKIFRPEADALFISCTALRAAETAEEIESATGKPVLTSNQVLAWRAARLAGCKKTTPGFGALLKTV